MARCFAEPIVSLPRPRMSERDRHHLFWPGADMNEAGLTVFRGLGCTSARNLDSTVHTLIHQRYSGVMGLRQHRYKRDFQKRANACLQAHESRRCLCFRRDSLRIVDALSLEVFSPKSFDRPPCTGIAVDARVFDLMVSYYETVAPISDEVRRALGARCSGALCACYVQEGGRIVHRPPSWSTVRRLRVA